MKICVNCGAENSNNAKFCKNCGGEIRIVKDIPTEETAIYSHEDSSSDGRYMKIFIIVLSVVLAILIGVAAWIFVNYGSEGTEIPDSDRSEKERKESVNDDKEAAEKNAETEAEEANQEKFERVITYSDGFYYDNLEEIYESESASDKECFELEKFMTLYNSLWISYINNGDISIYKYLREGTDAHTTTGVYSHPEFCEELLYMNVEDVRKSDNKYYVWCHEKIAKEWDSGEYTEKEYRWIYEIGKDSEGFYVEEYTGDPYYM